MSSLRKFTFAISSPDEFLVLTYINVCGAVYDFYRAAWNGSSGLAMRILSARLSVRLPVCQTCAYSIVTNRKKDLSRFFIPYERSFSLVF